MDQQRTSNKKDQMLEALRQSLGVVTDACKEVGIVPQTFYNWKNNDEEFRNAVEAIEYEAVDFARSMLFKRIAGMVIKRESIKDSVSIELPPDVNAIKFYLVHKGQKMGFGLNSRVPKPEPEKKQPFVPPVFILRPQGEEPEIIDYSQGQPK